MPQIQRAPQRLVRHHDAAIRYIGTRGSQNSSEHHGGVDRRDDALEQQEQRASAAPTSARASVAGEQRRRGEREVGEDHRVLRESRRRAASSRPCRSAPASAARRPRRRPARSRSESPMQGTPVRSTPKRTPISCSMPGLRLAALALRIARCAGRRTRASMRPPACASALCILSWIAFSVAMSNRPRPMPDWLVATTTRKPAWLSRAIASRLPGNRPPFVRRLDELVAVVVDHAVAVEDDRA